MTEPEPQAAPPIHPLDPLRADEIERAVEIARTQGRFTEDARVVSVTLEEPPKRAVLGRSPDRSVERRARLIAYRPSEATTIEAVVSLTERRVSSWQDLDGVQPAILPDEYLEAESAVKAHPDFHAALRRRGIEDLDLVTVDPVPASNLADLDPGAGRLCAALPFLRPRPGGNSYARPIEGIVGLVDLGTGEVLEIRDNGAVPLPPEEGEYAADAVGRLRDAARPISITQPEGPSFAVEAHEVRWERWRLRVGFTAREGLVLHTVGYEDGDELRPILHRASFSEMAVPYGDPSPNHYFQAPFDIGENNIGTLANSLTLGCDCVGLIHYFDAVVADARGQAVVIPNAICMHEEDYGMLWKHTDFRTGEVEVRRSRRLVLSSISTIGNYEYGFFWYLYQDGTIEAEVKPTGILATAAVPPGEEPRHGTLIAPELSGLVHQHFFNVRLDMTVDGVHNSVYEQHAERTPAGPANPHGNAFESITRLLRSEADARRLIDPPSARSWIVVNHQRRNRMGQPAGYRLIPGANVQSLAGGVAGERAGFAEYHLWVTPHHPTERFAAGEYPLLSQVGDGLPRWTEANRSIVDTDLVLWYSMGYHHVPRPEDWPVMPVDYIGFTLKPFGFFERNPALDVPPSGAEGSCAQ